MAYDTIRYKIDDLYRECWHVFLDIYRLNNNDAFIYRSHGIANYCKIYCLYSKLEQMGLTIGNFGDEEHSKQYSKEVKFKRYVVDKHSYLIYLELKKYFNMYLLNKKLNEELHHNDCETSPYKI